jgi:hypothetical protein
MPIRTKTVKKIMTRRERGSSERGTATSSAEGLVANQSDLSRTLEQRAGMSIDGRLTERFVAEG